MTTAGLVAVPSPDFAARAGAPETASPAATVKGTSSPQPSPATETRLALTGTPRTSTLRGTATWYDYRRGHAAAGPALRSALGPRWRGTTVRVSANGRTVAVVLSDWCGCPGGRVVDLDVRSFAVLADPSVGVLPVTVTLGPLPAPPATSTKGD